MMAFLEALLRVALIWIALSFFAGAVYCWLAELRARARARRRFGAPDSGKA